MQTFLPTNGRFAKSNYHDYNTKEEPNMKKLTFEQATSLLEQGIITQEAYKGMIADEDMQVFTYRAISEDKPQSVIGVNEMLLEIIKANALDLFNDNYKPTIVWKKIKDDVVTETAEPDTV